VEPKRPDEPQALVHGAAEGAPPADGEDTGVEIRAAERSAQRAAAVAATEGFHPLRVRPYVAEPDGLTPDTTETALLPLITAAEPGRDASAGTDLGLLPAMYGGLEYAEEKPEQDGPSAAAAAALRGRHRRRRRGLVVMAAAVAASALAAGAVAVTGQVMSDEQGTTDMALPDVPTTAMPDVTLPADAGPGLATTAAPVTHTPPVSVAAPSVSPSPVTSRAPVSTAPPPVVTVPPSAATLLPADPTLAPTTGVTPTPTSPSPTGQTFVPTTAAPVLELGDTGPAVADLQRRLAELWVYHGPVDGVFDHRTKAAVEVFQVWYWVSDAADGSHDGVYGPNTRAALEQHTS